MVKKINYKILFRKLRWIFIRVVLFFFISTIFVTILYRFVPPPITPLMVIRLFQQDKIRLYKDWERLKNISPHLPQAVVAAEDNHFLKHYGIDFGAIEKAQKYNERKKGKKIRGASTISQQTAKNVFLWPQRSWVRKGLEVYFTGLIELIWGKKRIMEVYLNVIEMGDGIYGVEAASRYYFHKSAKNLTKSEAALIASILPSPRKSNPARPSGYLLNRQAKILSLMGKVGKVKFD